MTNYPHLDAARGPARRARLCAPGPEPGSRPVPEPGAWRLPPADVVRKADPRRTVRRIPPDGAGRRRAFDALLPMTPAERLAEWAWRYHRLG